MPPAAPPKIVIGHRVFDETLVALTPYARVVAPNANDSDALSPERLGQELADADAWMAFMPDRADDDMLSLYPRLKLIAGALKGWDNFDLAACTRRGVWLSVVPDLLTEPTAELAIGLMIGLGRHLRQGDHHVRSGAFKAWEPRFYGVALAGARVGHAGMGAIGQAIAARLKPFGAVQRYVDPRPLDAGAQTELGLSREPALEALLAWSDYLVLGAPLTPDTHHIIDAAALAKVRPGCLLVNPARGSLVDETAVLAALETGQLGGYAADVFEMEDWALAQRPRAIAQDLLNHPATLFTPHLGSAVIEVRRAIERRATDNIIDALSGRLPRDALNPDASPPWLAGKSV
jgi:phosphonate dehydrogenase